MSRKQGNGGGGGSPFKGKYSPQRAKVVTEEVVASNSPKSAYQKSQLNRSTPLTDKTSGVPILYGSFENVAGAVSLPEFWKGQLRYLRIKYPDVADQIIT